MKGKNETAEEQARAWNGPSGRAWVENQQLLDEVLRPFEALLVEPLSLSQTRILDVGCGTGATTLAAARRLGPVGQSIGIDISEPMTAVAKDRARREGSSARFICANAQEHAFEPASVDVIISRFGVMFFEDPVRAFANLRRAGVSGAALRCIVWRSPAENPFMTTAERAAAPLLPELPCTLPETALVRYITQLGPVGRILQEADEATRTRVIEAIRPDFEPYVHGADVRFTTACWLITARA